MSKLYSIFVSLVITLLFFSLPMAYAKNISKVNNNVLTSVGKNNKKQNSYAYIKNEDIDTLFNQVTAIVKDNYLYDMSKQRMIVLSLKGLLSNLDPHSSFLDKKDLKALNTVTTGSYAGLGMYISKKDSSFIEVISPIEGTPASRAKIKPGDFIVKINGVSTYSMNTDEASNKMKGPAGTSVKLTILPKAGTALRTINIKRERIRIKSVSYFTEGDYGYIKIKIFNKGVAKNTLKAINSIKSKLGNKFKGLVIDLRGNPGGLLNEAIALSDLFINNGIIVSVKGRKIDENFRAKPGDVMKGMPIIALVNYGSASASEIVSGALQDSRRAVIMGTRTFGKGSVQTVFSTLSNTAVKLTTALYYTPDGTSIQDIGIYPDVLVKNPVPTKNNPKTTKKTNSIMDSLIREANLEGSLANIKKKKQTEILYSKKVKKDYQLVRAFDLLHAFHSLNIKIND